MATDAQIKAAKLKMDNAYSAIAPAKASMDSWYQLMTKCDTSDENLVLGESFGGKCHNGTAKNNPGCASKQTCESNVAKYNASVTNWETANTNYENAKDEYDTLIGSQTDTQISSIEQDAKKIRTQYYVGGALLITVIIIVVYVWMKNKKK